MWFVATKSVIPVFRKAAKNRSWFSKPECDAFTDSISHLRMEITWMGLSRKQLKVALARMGVLGFVNATLQIVRRIYLSFQVTTYPIKRGLYASLIAAFPNRTWAYERILPLLFSRRGRDPLGAASQFLIYFHSYLSKKPNIIFAWRRQAYSSYFLLHDIVGMQKVMQTYIDAQERFSKQLLGIAEFRIADSIFLSNYMIHAFMDTHIKAMQLGWQPNHRIVVLLRPEDVVCNPVMLGYWQKYIDVIDDPSIVKLLSHFSKYLTDDLSFAARIKGQGIYVEHAKHIVQKQWEVEGRKPLHQLNKEDCDFGWEQLHRLGIPKGAWFVSLHVRDAGCKLGSYQAKDDLDGFRNADINDYHLAIQSIIDRGGYVVRVGDPNMKPMSTMQGVIDYALSSIRSNRMDIFLFTQCRFFAGVASGPINTSILFGVPTVITNFAPMSARPQASNCVFIPKMLWLRDENRYATFNEVLSTDLGRISSSQGYEAKKIDVKDNSPEELNDVILEMLDRQDARCVYSTEDEDLQRKINSLYKTYSGYGDLGRVGRAFLKKYADAGLL